MSVVLVTGASGFLGGRLVRDLVSDGIDVIATGRNRQKLDALPVSNMAKFSADIRNINEVLSHKDQLKNVTQIVHCAALSSPWGVRQAFWDTNVTGTQAVLALAEALGVEHFVHISTPSVYFRFEDQFEVPETANLPKPINAYAETKARAEECVRASLIPSTILRPRGIYGSGDATLLPRMIRAARSGPLPVFRNGAAATDITHVSDVVSAIKAALFRTKETPFRTINVSGGVILPLQEIVNAACARAGISPRWKPMPFRPALAGVHIIETLARLRPGRPEPRVTAYGLGLLAFSQSLDLTMAKEHLSWTPAMSFDDGLDETFSSLQRS